jgi:hypothetical protein
MSRKKSLEEVALQWVIERLNLILFISKVERHETVEKTALFSFSFF